MNPISINLTVSPSQIQKQGDTYSITGLPATPELEQAMKPKFAPWKPREGQRTFLVTGHGDVIQVLWDSGEHDEKWALTNNRYPTRELAEWQAETEQITRRLNQAAVVYGGRTWPLGDCTWAPLVCEPNGRIISAYPWYFNGQPEREKFTKDFGADLTRLAELNAQITSEWQLYMQAK
jgi:hypothetical protein